MVKENILVIEHDQDSLELISSSLADEGYQVRTAPTGEEALRLIPLQPPDLILLNLKLTGINAFDVIRKVKGDTQSSQIPIAILSSKQDEADIIAGLEIGADDFITKPHSVKVLIARIRALLRRRRSESTERFPSIRIHELVIHQGRHEVWARDRRVNLTPSEFKLLRLLADSPGYVFTRRQIVESLRGSDYPVTNRAIDVLVVGLRKKLGPCGTYVETVRGVGYRLKEPTTP